MIIGCLRRHRRTRCRIDVPRCATRAHRHTTSRRRILSIQHRQLVTARQEDTRTKQPSRPKPLVACQTPADQHEPFSCIESGARRMPFSRARLNRYASPCRQMVIHYFHNEAFKCCNRCPYDEVCSNFDRRSASAICCLSLKSFGSTVMLHSESSELRLCAAAPAEMLVHAFALGLEGRLASSSCRTQCFFLHSRTCGE